MIVVDSAIVAYFVIKGTSTAMSEAVRAADADWHAPALLRHELISVVTKYLRQELLSRDEAVRAYRRALSLVKIDESLLNPVQIVNLHMASDCTTYDCQFIALAEKLSVQLVTTDAEILKAFPDKAIQPENFSNKN